MDSRDSKNLVDYQAESVGYLNTLIKIINSYIHKNFGAVKANRSGRQDDIRKIYDVIRSNLFDSTFKYPNSQQDNIDEWLLKPLSSITIEYITAKKIQKICDGIEQILKEMKVGVFGTKNAKASDPLRDVIKEHLALLRDVGNKLDQSEKISFLNMPVDIFRYISLFLTPQNLSTLSKTSKKLNALTNDEFIWKKQVESLLKDEEMPKLKKGETYKELYFRLTKLTPKSYAFFSEYTPEYEPLNFLNSKIINFSVFYMSSVFFHDNVEKMKNHIAVFARVKHYVNYIIGFDRSIKEMEKLFREIRKNDKFQIREFAKHVILIGPGTITDTSVLIPVKLKESKFIELSFPSLTETKTPKLR